MLKAIPKVAVIAFLNDWPFTATCFVPFRARVWFATGAYLRGVWSKFIIKDDGIEWCSTCSAIWCWNINLASFFASSGISGFDVVHVRFLNPMRLKRLFAQDVDSKSIHFKCSSWLLTISDFAVAIATTVFTTPPFLLTTCRKVWTFGSKVPDMSGLPRFRNEIFEKLSASFFFSSFSY